MDPLLNVLIFLASVAIISLSGVMMPGPVTAVTIAKGRESGNGGALIALGHGIIEIPLIVLIYLWVCGVFQPCDREKGHRVCWRLGTRFCGGTDI